MEQNQKSRPNHENQNDTTVKLNGGYHSRREFDSLITRHGLRDLRRHLRQWGSLGSSSHRRRRQGRIPRRSVLRRRQNLAGGGDIGGGLLLLLLLRGELRVAVEEVLDAVLGGLWKGLLGGGSRGRWWWRWSVVGFLPRRHFGIDLGFYCSILLLTESIFRCFFFFFHFVLWFALLERIGKGQKLYA